MLQPKNRNVPLTKTRLNFYIAKRAREVLQDSSLGIRDRPISKGSMKSKKYIKNQSQFNESLFGKSVQSFGKIEDAETSPYQLQSDRMEVGHRLVLSNERPGILKYRDDSSPKKSPYFPGQESADSLDQMVTSRKYNMPFSERGDYHKNNISELSYFNHQNSLIHGKQNHKGVNWGQTIRSNQRMGCDMKDISHKLSSITFQLNRNNRKLKQFSQLQSPLNHPSKQQTLKRVNFKHSKAMQVERTKAQLVEKVPRVQYYERSFHEPRFQIFHPLH